MEAADGVAIDSLEELALSLKQSIDEGARQFVIIRSVVHLSSSSAAGEESVAAVEEDRVEPLRFLPSSFSLMLLVVSISPAPDSSSWNRRNIFWRWLTCFL